MKKGDKVKFLEDKKNEFIMKIRHVGKRMSVVDLPDGDWCYVDNNDITLVEEIKENGTSKD